MYTPYWDVFSMFLYVLMGLIGMICLSKAISVKEKSRKMARQYLGIGVGIWTFFAAFRFIYYGVGGADAYAYVGYFNDCLSGKGVYAYSDHMDWLMGMIIKCIRFFTGEVHIFLIVMYGFMAWTYLYFIYKFANKRASSVPYFLTFYLYLRGFNTMRSNFCICFILWGIVWLLSSRRYRSYIWAFSSVLVHKAGLLFAMAIPFVKIFKKKGISIPWAIALTTLSSVAGTILQTFFLQQFADVDLGGSYQSYASNSLEGSFLDNSWKIAFEQMLLAAFMFLGIKGLRKQWRSYGDTERKKIDIIYLVCILDFMLIPVNYIMGIWRGYEFFYLPRLIMWGEVVGLFVNKCPKKIRQIVSLVVLICFIAWMVFRVYSTYEDSALMPYIFEPLMYF